MFAKRSGPWTHATSITLFIHGSACHAGAGSASLSERQLYSLSLFRDLLSQIHVTDFDEFVDFWDDVAVFDGGGEGVRD